MSFLAINYGHYEFWEAYDPINGFYGPQKCVFDGPNKLIIVSDGVTELDIKQDVYSDWKEWVQYGDNSKFLAAIRSTGGDPIAGTTTFTGDVYFLINGWKLVINLTKVAVTGVLYSDDFNTAYYTPELVAQFPVRVSAIVNVVATETISGITVPTVEDIRNEMDTNSIKLLQIKAILDSMTVPTTVQIRQEIDANSTKLQEISTKQDQALTKGDFIALQ